EAGERVVALEAEHHADREPADDDDDDREHAELVELVDEGAQADGRREDGARDAGREAGPSPEVCDEAVGEVAQVRDPAGHATASSGPRNACTSWSRLASSSRGSPVTTRSGSKSATQLASRIVDGTSWETTSIVLSKRRFTSARSFSMSRVEIGSRPEKGSS